MTALAGPKRPASRVWNWLVAAALAVIAVIAADALRQPAEIAAQAPPLDPATLRPGFGPATFAEGLAAADREVEGRRADNERRPGEWLRMEFLARALLARFRLTADPADLAEADRLLDRALEIAPWPAGPALAGAEASLARHDLDGAAEALARFDASAVPPPAQEQAVADSIRCEIAFEREGAAAAREACGGADMASLLRRANLLAKTGEVAPAIQLVESQLRLPRLPPHALATLSLQRAALALAQGDWTASGEWVRTAERVFPGYWLSEAFVAQQFALEGNRAEAIRRYADVAERTGDPDVLGALARLAQAEGRGADAQRWAMQAGAAWDARARLLPGTYASHHAEHLLLHGDPERAVALAEADYRKRPYPGTIVHYAYALWRTGRAAEALEVVRAGHAAGFVTAEMTQVEAVALGSLGRSAEAGRALAEARRLNPRIDSPGQQHVVFGRD